MRRRERTTTAVVGVAAMTVVVAAGLLAGCGSSDGGLSAAGVEGDLRDTARQMGVTIPDDWQVSEQQRRAFDDGRVSYEEYEAAKISLVRCLRDHGLQADDPVRDESRSATGTFLAFTWSENGQPEQAALATYTRCFAEQDAVVDAGWLRQNLGSREDQERRVRATLECVRGRGEPVANLRELMASLDAESRRGASPAGSSLASSRGAVILDCLRQHPIETSAPGEIEKLQDVG